MPAANRRFGTLSITYHDVVELRRHHQSGFLGSWAKIYKLEPHEFAMHLEAIRGVIGNRAIGSTETGEPGRICLTFDDGGVSAYQTVASMLERHGWRGHFFVATDWIGKPGFLNEEQLRELDRRGHVIGSHSCSHPTRMAHLPWAEMLREWTESTSRLAQILGHPVTIASVPGGYYSRAVANAAAYAGIQTLFTSEPTTTVDRVEGCQVLGRYVVQQGMGPEWSAGFAAGQVVPRLKQAVMWKAKGAAKRLGGKVYLHLAATILNARQA
jgi:peptidoglycan/xylan/chitin deacetylase (PgdA/CDA1 family)